MHPAVPGNYNNLGNSNRRLVNFGNVDDDDYDRFGGAQLQASLKDLADKAAKLVNENTPQAIKDLIAAAQKQ
ncbi:MAG: hypothetical protein V1909_01555 [Candidatus Micrarchaeota archaeon]